jgi:nucleoside 2-deoxyribosyltransferase
MKIFFAHSSAYDFVNELYTPLKTSAALQKHELVLPMDDGCQGKSREEVKSCDILIAEVSLPSTGQGMEIGWADAMSIPIFTLAKEGSSPSKALRYVTDKIHVYTDSQSLVVTVEDIINQLKLPLKK